MSFVFICYCSSHSTIFYCDGKQYNNHMLPGVPGETMKEVYFAFGKKNNFFVAKCTLYNMFLYPFFLITSSIPKNIETRGKMVRDEADVVGREYR